METIGSRKNLQTLPHRQSDIEYKKYWDNFNTELYALVRQTKKNKTSLTNNKQLGNYKWN